MAERLLNERQQFTILNGKQSDLAAVPTGVPQGSVLGPTLFTLFSNNLPSSIISGSIYMYADDTTIYCIGETADMAVAQLNKALDEIYKWCLKNRLTPHPGKSEVMLLSRRTVQGPLAPARLGHSILNWVTTTRLLGMTVDNKITWVQNTLELKKSFAKNRNLLL